MHLCFTPNGQDITPYSPTDLTHALTSVYCNNLQHLYHLNLPFGACKPFLLETTAPFPLVFRVFVYRGVNYCVLVRLWEHVVLWSCNAQTVICFTLVSTSLSTLLTIISIDLCTTLSFVFFFGGGDTLLFQTMLVLSKHSVASLPARPSMHFNHYSSHQCLTEYLLK